MLESYHVSETFQIFKNKDNNILVNLSKEEYRVVRSRMIECILATDFTNHSKHLTQLRSKIDALEIVNGKNIDLLFTDNKTKNHENQQIILNMIIHSADVSNPAKPFAIYKKWIDLLFIEFFNQGDLEKEKGLPVSLLCDRESTNINKSQLGFITYVVKPTFECLLCMIPECSPYKVHILENLTHFENALKQEDQKTS